MNNQASLGHLFLGMDYRQWLFAVNSELTMINCFPEIWQQAVAKLVSESACSKGLGHE
jgi:hypothetical protein